MWNGRELQQGTRPEAEGMILSSGSSTPHRVTWIPTFIGYASLSHDLAHDYKQSRPSSSLYCGDPLISVEDNHVIFAIGLCRSDNYYQMI